MPMLHQLILDLGRTEVVQRIEEVIDLEQLEDGPLLQLLVALEAHPMKPPAPECTGGPPRWQSVWIERLP